MEFLRLAKLLALSLVCCLSMAACSKDSDDSGAKEPEDPDPYYMLEKLDASFSVIANEDVAEIADVSCVVTDFKGESKSYKLNKNNIIEVSVTAEQPSDDSWMSEMTRAAWINLPVTTKIEVNMTPKQNFAPDPERTMRAPSVALRIPPSSAAPAPRGRRAAALPAARGTASRDCSRV